MLFVHYSFITEYVIVSIYISPHTHTQSVLKKTWLQKLLCWLPICQIDQARCNHCSETVKLWTKHWEFLKHRWEFQYQNICICPIKRSKYYGLPWRCFFGRLGELDLNISWTLEGKSMNEWQNSLQTSPYSFSTACLSANSGSDKVYCCLAVAGGLRLLLGCRWLLVPARKGVALCEQESPFLGVHAYCIIEWTHPFHSHSHLHLRQSSLIHSMLWKGCQGLCNHYSFQSTCFPCVVRLSFYWEKAVVSLPISSFVKQQKQEPPVKILCGKCSLHFPGPRSAHDLLYSFSAEHQVLFSMVASSKGLRWFWESAPSHHSVPNWGHCSLASFSLGRSAKLVLPACWSVVLWCCCWHHCMVGLSKNFGCRSWEPKE